MGSNESVVKKISRLKKKVAALKPAAAADAGGKEILRTWHKRLKRVQRRKALQEKTKVKLDAKKTKKKKGEGAEAGKTEAAAS